jgi:hypothetical protein
MLTSSIAFDLANHALDPTSSFPLGKMRPRWKRLQLDAMGGLNFGSERLTAALASPEPRLPSTIAPYAA